MRIIGLLLLFVALVACGEAERPAPVEAYGYWSGEVFISGGLETDSVINADYDEDSWSWCFDVNCVFGRTDGWDLLYEYEVDGEDMTDVFRGYKIGSNVYVRFNDKENSRVFHSHLEPTDRPAVERTSLNIFEGPLSDFVKGE